MNTPVRLQLSADGWRGVIHEGFTATKAGVLAGCVVRAVTLAKGEPSVLVSHDGRRSGATAAHAAARQARAAGVRQLRLVPHLPTPTATAAVRLGRVDLALLITASHNPPRWNGVKVKVAPGCPPSRALERAIDQSFDRVMRSTAHDGLGQADPGEQETALQAGQDLGEDLVREHIADVLARLSSRPTRPLRVVVDGLGGVAGGPVARLCTELNWDVDQIGCLPDPEFGGLVPDPSVPESRQRTAERVRASDADLGVVLDGDGDRIFVLDRHGRTVQSHELFALLLGHRWRNAHGSSGGGVGITVSTGTAVRRVAELTGVPVIEVGIGFKHLSPLLATGQVDAAGGSVGDLCFAEFGLDRDPFAVLVLLADLLDVTGGTVAGLLDDLRARLGHLRWFESRLDACADNDLLRIVGHKALTDAGLGATVAGVTETDGVKLWLPDGQWVLLRPSSTEGGVRIYGELTETAAVGRQVTALVEAVRSGLTPLASQAR